MSDIKLPPLPERPEGTGEWHKWEERLIQAYACAAVQANVPDGWVMVKRVATDEMIAAAEEVEDLYLCGTPNTWAKVWDAMLSAIPKE